MPKRQERTQLPFRTSEGWLSLSPNPVFQAIMSSREKIIFMQRFSLDLVCKVGFGCRKMCKVVSQAGGGEQQWKEQSQEDLKMLRVGKLEHVLPAGSREANGRGSWRLRWWGRPFPAWRVCFSAPRSRKGSYTGHCFLDFTFAASNNFYANTEWVMYLVRTAHLLWLWMLENEQQFRIQPIPYLSHRWQLITK